ncbi:MAG: DUF1996 domain-containing protein [Sphingomonas sp.]|nr:DUF1996 domain-containing protein [Sphingomonas sp.]
MRIRTVVALCALVLAGCKTETPTDSSATTLGKKTCLDGTQPKGNSCAPASSTTTTTPTPTSTPTPTTGTTVVAASLAGAAAIADNFDTSSWLEPGEAPHTSPDAVGAFRFTCLAGQLSHDDPIVYPGQPGASHLHQFFGNTGTSASSNYNSLRTSGGSTCTRSATESPQRSAYWMPAMLDGAGNAVKPDWVNTYYKRLPPSDPQCAKTTDPTVIGQCIEMPNGLRFILGYNMATNSGGPTDTNSADYWAMGFDCVMTDGSGTSYTGVKHTITDILATGKCPINAWLRVYLTFPACWDGKNLDTPDHRSHMTFGVTAVGCPADHPYNIPEIAIQGFFRTDANFLAGKWHLASDEMMQGTVPGATLHMDYWEAWSPTMKALWNANCIDGHLTCSSGNVGDGRQIKGMSMSGMGNHVLVPLNTIP